MAELKWVGPSAAGNSAAEVPTVSDLTAKAATALTSAQIDSQIASGFTDYAQTSYVDTQDSAKALKTYVDSQDATKMLKTLRGQPNGAIPLDSDGLVPKVNITNTYPTGWRSLRWAYSPASYTAGVQANLSLRDQVKMCADIVVPDPGYAYKLLPYGYWEGWCETSATQAWPEIRVKVDTEIIGWGRGAWNVTEGHQVQVVPYDPNDVWFTGSVTVTTWGGRNRWGTNAGRVSLTDGAGLTPARLCIIQAAAKAT